jgi:hypothetical protein
MGLDMIFHLADLIGWLGGGRAWKGDWREEGDDKWDPTSVGEGGGQRTGSVITGMGRGLLLRLGWMVPPQPFSFSYFFFHFYFSKFLFVSYILQLCIKSIQTTFNFFVKFTARFQTINRTSF